MDERERIRHHVNRIAGAAGLPGQDQRELYDQLGGYSLPKPQVFHPATQGTSSKPQATEKI